MFIRGVAFAVVCGVASFAGDFNGDGRLDLVGYTLANTIAILGVANQ